MLQLSTPVRTPESYRDESPPLGVDHLGPGKVGGGAAPGEVDIEEGKGGEEDEASHAEVDEQNVAGGPQSSVSCEALISGRSIEEQKEGIFQPKFQVRSF